MDKEQLREALKGLLEESRGNPRGYVKPICNRCRHRMPGAKCKAFPNGIPDEILFNQADHRKPYPGDRGIQFEEKD